MNPSPALLILSAELKSQAETLIDCGFPHVAASLSRMSQLAVREYLQMGLFANAIKKVQDELAEARTEASANATDAKTLASLRSAGMVADQEDIDAANAVLHPVEVAPSPETLPQ